MKRFYVDFRDGSICVIDRRTDKIIIRCLTEIEAKTHARGLNR